MQLPIFCSSCAGSLPPVVAGDSPCLITMDLGDAAGTRAVLVIEKKTERERERMRVHLHFVSPCKGGLSSSIDCSAVPLPN